MRGFRNILIHEYSELNDAIAYGNIKAWLNEWKKIIKFINKINLLIKL